jgi:hypothetical protein
MIRLYCFALILWVAATPVAPAQQSPARPNFTGIWNLDKEKSDFGGLPAPQSARYLIRHLGAKLEMQYEHDEQTTRVDVIPDGEEHLLETLPDSENLARVYWSGSVLVFDGRIKPSASSNAVPIKWTSRWTLSPDKRVLTIERHMTANQSSADQKVFFNKEAAQSKAQ